MYSVGQKIFAVFSQRNRPTTTSLEITKVGRKWLELNGGRYRADINSLYLDGGAYMPPGKCYLSEDDWVAEKTLNMSWDQLRCKVRDETKPPSGVTPEKVKQVMAILGLTPNVELTGAARLYRAASSDRRERG